MCDRTKTNTLRDFIAIGNKIDYRVESLATEGPQSLGDILMRECRDAESSKTNGTFVSPE